MVPAQYSHHQNALGREPVNDLWRANARIRGEHGLKALDIGRLLLEIHLRFHSNGELPHHVRQSTDVVVWKKDVQPEEQPE